MTPEQARALLATLGTQRQAAEALGVGLRTIERWCAEGCEGFTARALTAMPSWNRCGGAKAPPAHTAIVADDPAQRQPRESTT